jgi:hypothetical protein
VQDPRNRPDDRPPNDSLGLVEGVQALQGEELPDDQDAFLEPDEIEGPRQYTRTELDQGDPLPDPAYVADEITSYDGGDIEGMREGETSDAGVATQEGLTWVPPMDPPVTPRADTADGIEVAAGTATSALDEPYDDSHRSTELADGGELNERIHEALRADAETADLVDQLVVAVVGGRAYVRGVVLTVDDSDAIAAVIERVAGIDEVVDETELAETLS